jgi:hypothetical protein
MPYKDPEIAKIKSRERNKKWNKENKERKSMSNKLLYQRDKKKKREQNKKWQEKNRHKMVEYQRKSRYGITPEEYKKLLEQQNNSCYICKKKMQSYV